MCYLYRVSICILQIEAALDYKLPGYNTPQVCARSLSCTVTRRFEYPLHQCSLKTTSKPDWLHLSFSAGMLPFAHFTWKMCLWQCFWLHWDHFGLQVAPSGVQMSSKNSTIYLCSHWVLLHHTQIGPEFLHSQQNHSSCVMNPKTMVE